MKNFDNKVAVVTGAGSGMGRELAYQLASAGAKIAVLDFNALALEETERHLLASGTEVFAKTVDVSQKEQVFAFADEVMARFGRVDILINNAGVALGQVRVDDQKMEDMEWIVGINQWGVVYGTMAFLPHLKKSPEAALVNLSSIFGIVGIATQSAYCMTKFAVRGFTESLRMESVGSSLTITTIHPGNVKTNIVNNSRDHNTKAKERLATRFDRMPGVTASDAARQIIEGIRHKRTRVVIGTDAKRMDWLSRLMPERYTSILLNVFKKNKLEA